MATEIACLLVDFGNVIAWVDHRRACRRLADLTGGLLQEAEVYERIFGSGLEAQYDRGEWSTQAFLAELQERLALSAAPELIAAAWCDIFTSNPAMIDFVSRVHRAGLRLVLASNTNELHANWIRQHFRVILRSFHHLVLSHEIQLRKPEEGFFQACVANAACAPQACLYFDDRQDFVAAARGLGINGVVYERHTDLPELCREYGLVGSEGPSD